MMLLLLINNAYSISFDYDDEETKTIISKVFLGTEETSALIPRQIIKIQSNKDASAFGDVKNILESIEFEDNSMIETIGIYCFYQCTSLKRADFSKCKKLTILNEYTFNYCSSLTDIQFPPNLDRILSYCFYGCHSIEEFLLPNTTSTLFQSSFGLCPKLKRFFVTPNITSIQDGCFYGCSQLAKVEYIGIPVIKSWGGYSLGTSIIESFFLPKTVTSVGACLFEGCSKITNVEVEKGSIFYYENGMIFYNDNKTLHIGLKSIKGILNISENIEKVSSHIFKFCDKVTEIHFLNEKTKFEGSDHFFGCTSLKKVTLPTAIISVPPNMFYSCISIEEIILPPNITNIYSNAFYNCYNLKHLHLSANITSFGSGSFAGVPSNITITSDSGSNYILDNNHLFSDNYSSLIAFLGEAGDVTIPSNTITIIGLAYYNKQISSVIFEGPSKLKFIHEGAFRSCTKLKKVILPDTVENIFNFAFQGCTSIEEFYFGQSLLKIQEKTFYNFGSPSGVKSTCLPSSLVSIGVSSFENSNFIELKIESDSNLTTISERAFYGMPLISSLSFSSSLSSIAKQCFSSSSFTKVSFEDSCSIESIPVESFIDCSSLKEIVISSKVKKIDEKAFAKCSAISSIMIGRSVESISYLAFGECTSLESFIIPPSSQLTEIMGQAFFGCIKLKTFTIFGSSEFVAKGGSLYGKNGKTMFTYLSGSEDKIVKIEEGVEKINKFAFQMATGVEEIHLPSTLREVGFRSFDRCVSLKKLVVKSKEFNVESEAFRECLLLDQCECIYFDMEVGTENELEEIKNILIEGGISENGFKECSTFLFTQNCILSHRPIMTLINMIEVYKK